MAISYEAGKGSAINLNSSVDRYKNNQPDEIANNIFNMIDTILVSLAMMFIARYCFIFAVLQFVVNSLLLFIAPCQKETISHSKHHPTEDFRIKDMQIITRYIFSRFPSISQSGIFVRSFRVYQIQFV